MTRNDKMKYRQRLLDWPMLDLTNWINPHAISLTFKQVAFLEPYSSVPLTETEARESVDFLLRNLNRKLLAKKDLQAGFRLGAAFVMERSAAQRLHCHGIIECPVNKAAHPLPMLVQRYWSKALWGYREIKIEPADAGWIDYIFKLKDKPDYSSAFEYELWHEPLSTTKR